MGLFIRKHRENYKSLPSTIVPASRIIGWEGAWNRRSVSKGKKTFHIARSGWLTGIGASPNMNHEKDEGYSNRLPFHQGKEKKARITSFLR